ncbi:hypothetical protein PS914_03993 [Pseudomonas fluorescens]|uniref:hypothetical protein n=1 Tax=Pseudomonas fluorescens TaxID=294 RepID=UPI001240C728|nr:hypothetical protein [Pseudomonas fluorescens]VVQ00302.1 hypothetical protein PS914_03993 [Pseudomonas fluorescens]
MSKNKQNRPTTCYFPESGVTPQTTPDTEVSPPIDADAPAQAPATAGISSRRANFAAPGDRDDKKRTKGSGLDSLGGGRLD